MDSIGVSITLDGNSVEEALRRLRPFISFNPAELMEQIAGLGESQTRNRISVEKTAPDGTPWQPNRAGTPTLDQTGQHLLGSLAFHASADEAVWGASWEFSHIHQEGAVITAANGKTLTFHTKDGWRSKKSVTIPARPFVGLSAENRVEIEDLVTDYFGHLR